MQNAVPSNLISEVEVESNLGTKIHPNKPVVK